MLTLFISIFSYIPHTDFYATTGQIAVGQHVTVESMGEENAFFATVLRFEDDGKGEATIYHLENEAGERIAAQRKHLRWRNEKRIAHIFATGDRKHDTHAVQHFLVDAA